MSNHRAIVRGERRRFFVVPEESRSARFFFLLFLFFVFCFLFFLKKGTRNLARKQSVLLGRRSRVIRS